MSRVVTETESLVKYIIGMTDPDLVVRVYDYNSDKELLVIEDFIDYTNKKNDPCLQAEIGVINVVKGELIIQVNYEE